MTYTKAKGSAMKWITVPIDARLHAEVRARQVRLDQSWPTVIADAMRLWLDDRDRK